MPRKKVEHEDIVGTKVAAHVLGVTPRRLGQLVNDGKIPKVGNGKYDLPKVVAAYVKHKVDDATRHSRAGSTADKLRERREQQIARRIAREDRELIPMTEAEATVDEMTGVYLASISGLPARITRKPVERQRIEKICDEERLRLSDRFAESRTTLQSGKPPSEADDEDDA